MEYLDTIYEGQRDGWSIVARTAPDDFYEPGRDDDLYAVPSPYPRDGLDSLTVLCPKCDGTGEECGHETDDGAYGARECPKCEGMGEVPDPDAFTVDYRTGPMVVTGEECRRVMELTGATRETIESDARAIGHEYLTWLGVVVTATRGNVEGSASLWGIDYDTRSRDSWQESDCYLQEIVRELVPDAINDAAGQLLGSMKTQALSYD